MLSNNIMSISVCFQVDAELNTSATVFSLTNARSGPQSPESRSSSARSTGIGQLCPTSVAASASYHVSCFLLLHRNTLYCLPNVCFSSKCLLFILSLSFSFILFLLYVVRTHPVYKSSASCYSSFADTAILACRTELLEFDIS
jgi:hypothetical protein